jgi:hypothetical protein
MPPARRRNTSHKDLFDGSPSIAQALACGVPTERITLPAILITQTQVVIGRDSQEIP